MKTEHEIKSELSIRDISEEEIALRDSHDVKFQYERILYDPTGKVVERRIEDCKSFLTNFAKAWYALVKIGVNTVTYTDILGNVRTNVVTEDLSAQTTLDCSGIAGEDTRGIVVGTGTNAVTEADTKLQTRVLHGVGVAGKLDYKITEFEQPATSGGTISSFVISRKFTNTSGSTITLTECGLYGAFKRISAEDNVCYIRDVDAGGFAIPNNFTAEVRYTISGSI